MKLQSQSQLYSSPGDAVRKTLAREGVAGLYRGFLPPLATVAAFNAVLFSARGVMENALAHRDGRERVRKGFGDGEEG